MDFAHQIGSATLVIGLLVGAMAIARRRGLLQSALSFARPPAHARRLEMIERLTLNPNHVLYLVRVDDRSLLLATAPGVCQLVESHPSNKSTGASR